MVRPYFLLILTIILLSNTVQGQHHQFGFDKVLKEQPDIKTTFCVPNNDVTHTLLDKEGIAVKYSTKNWSFITTTPSWIDQKYKSGELKNYYFEYAPPMALADSAVFRHHGKEVHQGLGGLSSSYSGKDVIIGVVDQGLDWTHPDFVNEDGSTRVLRYWDQTINSGGTVAQPYNYGIVWDSAQINSGACFSTENSTAHGTTVAGMAVGNGRANGTNKGFAPEADIIIVESNFSLPNWTLSIADACDYIFKVADTLGKPAVVNLSLGTYLGSHDGNDPAAEYIEALMDEQPGRIVVCAAGNSGANPNYHVRGEIDSDTSFVWILNNPSTSAAFGPNHIYFDLWSDIADATFDFAFGADLPAPTYGFRGRSNFHGAMSSIGVPILDTIYNMNGNRIATVETYTEIVDGNYHMEVYFSNVDSTSYQYRFMTKGSGMYDLWSAAFMGLNTLVVSIPSPSVEPDIIHYHRPDSLQSIVSSWNCSEKVVSVGQVKNRTHHIDNNGNVVNSDARPVGALNPSSSKGPNRHDVLKPDVVASGDLTLTAGPMWLLNNPAMNGVIDSGGWHVRNGGTSMASPIVAGIAALYLEKCSRSNNLNFKDDLIATTFADGNTGPLPNFRYGNGNANALDLLLMNEFTAQITGNSGICSESVLGLYSTESLSTAYWSNGNEGLTNTITAPGQYTATVYNTKGCKTETNPFNVIQLDFLPILPIIQSGNTLATLSLTTYQWTLNGVDIPGATNSTLVITPPGGTYTCYCVSDEGCISETPPYTVVLSVDDMKNMPLIVYPNPSSNCFTIKTDQSVKSVKVIDLNGKEVELVRQFDNSYSIAALPKGNYQLIIELEHEKIYSKITRM
jgi:subtilisin family serine protease